jgi:hypothetical protein
MLSQQNQWQNQRLKQPHQLILLSQLLHNQLLLLDRYLLLLL